MLITLVCGDVHVVGLDLDLGVDQLEGLLGGLDFRHAHLSGGEEEAVHVGQLDLVVIVED